MSNSKQEIDAAWELLATGKFQEAIYATTPLIVKDQCSASLLQLRGIAYRMLNQFKNAIRYLEQATYISPLRADAAFALAESYEKVGKRDLGLWMFQQVAIRKDLPPKMFSPLAMQLGRLGDNQTALVVCKRACRIERDLPESYFAVAYYMRKLGKPINVILPYLAQAHQLNPEEVIYRMAYASLLKMVGRISESEELLAAVEIDSSACENCLENILRVFQTK